MKELSGLIQRYKQLLPAKRLWLLNYQTPPCQLIVGYSNSHPTFQLVHYLPQAVPCKQGCIERKTVISCSHSPSFRSLLHKLPFYPPTQFNIDPKYCCYHCTHQNLLQLAGYGPRWKCIIEDSIRPLSKCLQEKVYWLLKKDRENKVFSKSYCRYRNCPKDDTKSSQIYQTSYY